jgi:hypothetical protein
MADYRLDCCGGFPGHEPGCRALAEAPVREAATAEKKAILDKLYQRYGELMVSVQREPGEHSSVFQAQANVMLEAIRIVEGE